jgi:hypothetical protein
MGTISNPMGITAPTETGDSSDRARSSTVNGPLASLPGGLGSPYDTVIHGRRTDVHDEW